MAPTLQLREAHEVERELPELYNPPYLIRTTE